MKQNKNIDPTQELELTIHPDYQTSPFVVRGPGEAVKQQAEAIQALDAQTPTRSIKLGKAVLEAPTQAVAPELAYGFKADMTARIHDIRFGTSFLQALRNERQLRRDLSVATKLGLLTVEPCARHRNALETVRTLRQYGGIRLASPLLQLRYFVDI